MPSKANRSLISSTLWPVSTIETFRYIPSLIRGNVKTFYSVNVPVNRQLSLLSTSYLSKVIFGVVYRRDVLLLTP